MDRTGASGASNAGSIPAGDTKGNRRLKGGLAEWHCDGPENHWEKSLAGSSPAPSA